MNYLYNHSIAMSKALIRRYHLLVPHEFPSNSEFGRVVLREYLQHPYEVPYRPDFERECKINQSFAFTRFQHQFIAKIVNEGTNFSLFFRAIMLDYLNRYHPETQDATCHPHSKALFLRDQQRKLELKEFRENIPSFYNDIPLEIVALARKHGADWIG